MIEAARRLPEAEELIREKNYFVVHAARQSGKTTCLKDIVQRLSAQGKYYALYCTLEKLQGVEEAEKGIPGVVSCVRNSLLLSEIPGGRDFGMGGDKEDYTSFLQMAITQFCGKLDKPLVILFDEVDCLSEGTLISFLRQLRAGYVERTSGTSFACSVGLVGMRNIRDYKAKVRPGGETLGSASPFNIVTKTLTLENFTIDEIVELYGQHTGDTGQEFEAGIAELVYAQTAGQPWLVNAIAREVIVEGLGKDYTKVVTCEMVKTAIQRIILNRPTHIDSLMERLREPRVRHIVEDMILGEIGPNPAEDDYLYCLDLGLVRQEKGRLIPSNPIYAEVIARKLSEWPQMAMTASDTPVEPNTFFHDGQIDMSRLLEAFRSFWREHSEVWIEKLEYSEAAAHLVTFAFLQRVINGGGQIIREMATGRGRLDICILYKDRKYPIELKVRREKDSLETILAKGLAQLSGYMDSLGCKEGWLLIFDKREHVTWEEKLFRREDSSGKHITVLGA
jgi:hypothetical protein